MTLDEVTRGAVDPALKILPPYMDSQRARVLLLTIGLQESRLTARRQAGNGPARGLWQFEIGSKISRGGVWGVYLHSASHPYLVDLCHERGVAMDPVAIYSTLEHDDILAAGVARLLLVTDPAKLPEASDVDGAWKLYAERCWRPGKPHPETWAAYHAQARAFVMGPTV